jgi:SRSO17 transposase
MAFRTKPQLARDMLERALDAEVPAAWVTADEVYGGDPALRCWLEACGMSYVLAIKCTEPLAVPGPDGSARVSAGRAPRAAACTTGHGSSWPCRPQPARLAAGAPQPPRRRVGLLRLLRPSRHLASRLVRVAGARRALEDGFEQAKGEVGLDHYEVRKWPGWYRHITLALLAHTFLVVTRGQARATNCDQTKGDTRA